MQITMNNSSKTSIKQIEKCIKHLPGVEFKAEDRYQAYKWINGIFKVIKYSKLSSIK